MRCRETCCAVAAAVAAGLGLAASAPAATNECNGLKSCVPVAGPWVIVPPGTTLPRTQVAYDLSCPKGYIVGGLDAELSDPEIDLTFLGAIGAPVNPGITTARDVVFLGRFVGVSPHGPSFRPHIGCMPSSGGGQRIPTSATVQSRRATVRHVRNVALTPGRRTVVQRCAPGERLVDGSYAVAFARPTAPGASLAAAVSATRAFRGGGVSVAVRASPAVRGRHALLQVSALCAGGGP